MSNRTQGGEALDMALGLPWSDSVALPAEPASATSARHFVRRILLAADVTPDLIDCVELVASELVTNAVLHAGTSPTVKVHLSEDTIRLEVRDASTATPSVEHFSKHASTGRGLSVVSRMAQDWGFDADQYGKTVWADFAVDPNAIENADNPPQITTEVIIDEHLGRDAKLIRFKAVPVALYMELEEANDATLREFELLAIQIDNDAVDQLHHIHKRLAELLVRSHAFLGPSKTRLRSTTRRAHHRGSKTVDLKMYVDGEYLKFVREFAELMAQADDLSNRNILLTSPPREPVKALRWWFVSEMENQYNLGAAPTTFSNF